jgi:uncharacterized protein YjbI with pentapeptide repeats
MSRSAHVALWLILVLGLFVAALLVVTGAYLLKPYWGERQTRADVGIALITLSVISLAVFVLQVLDENRIEKDDARRQREAAAASSALQVGLQHQAFVLQLELKDNLRKMFLPPGTDMHGIFLLQKDLRYAVLEQVDLHGSVLNGSQLAGADLNGVDLQGAKLEGGHFFAVSKGEPLPVVMDGANLSGTDFEGADLRQAELTNADLRRADVAGARLAGADWSGAKLAGLRYDSTTVFPGKPSRRCRPGRSCKLPAGAKGGDNGAVVRSTK